MVGIAWASILSMPYSMLAGHLPENKIGIYMGIFNFFIVLPEILASQMVAARISRIPPICTASSLSLCR